MVWTNQEQPDFRQDRDWRSPANQRKPQAVEPDHNIHLTDNRTQDSNGVRPRPPTTDFDLLWYLNCEGFVDLTTSLGLPLSSESVKVQWQQTTTEGQKWQVDNGASKNGNRLLKT